MSTDGPLTTRCARHPEVETSLRCGKCGTPICPRCMVQTPVGARCPDCARLNRLPTFRVSGVYYLRAAGAALITAVVAGIIWGFINNFVPFFYLNLILAGGVGYVIGEAIGFSTNRKRGRWLAVIGGTAVVLSYLVNIFTFGAIPGSPLWIIFDLVSVGVGVYTAVNRLR
jgi:hypothetical protein